MTQLARTPATTQVRGERADTCQCRGVTPHRRVDAGLASTATGDFRAAYEHFTEAIRLSPLKAAYHANRASAALRLQNARGAAEDAESAVRLCPEHVTAHLRGERAYLELQNAEARLGTSLGVNNLTLRSLAGCAAAFRGGAVHPAGPLCCGEGEARESLGDRP